MKKISEELKSTRCCGQTGEKDSLVLLAEEWEQKVKDLLSEVDELNSNLNSAYDDLSDLNSEEVEIESAFYMGAKSGLNRENTLKAWLNYKIESKL